LDYSAYLSSKSRAFYSDGNDRSLLAFLRNQGYVASKPVEAGRILALLEREELICPAPAWTLAAQAWIRLLQTH
jgi:hypothetical protein